MNSGRNLWKNYFPELIPCQTIRWWSRSSLTLYFNCLIFQISGLKFFSLQVWLWIQINFTLSFKILKLFSQMSKIVSEENRKVIQFKIPDLSVVTKRVKVINHHPRARILSDQYAWGETVAALIKRFVMNVALRL